MKTSQLDFRFWGVLKRQGIVINVWVSSLIQDTKRRWKGSECLGFGLQPQTGAWMAVWFPGAVGDLQIG